jgi:3-hydroxy-9,10-secoandrosta-1,3,5(10)-triene-9,17-dione monooxygenase reductase component
MTIQSSDPFATPDDLRSPVRKMRGRLPSAVTLWTAAGHDGTRAGLTVSSTQIVDGEPGRLIGLLDDESELWSAASASGRFAVMPLGAADRQLADRFAGLLPAPGGLFVGYQWEQTDWGPVLGGRSAWLGCHLDDARPLGWSLLVEATIEHVSIDSSDEPPLLHHRGRYRELP